MVSTHYPACARRKCGFTLIELMVATAIMAMLIMAVMTITSHVLSSWSSASGRLGANAEARIALQHLGDDLETLVVRPRSQVWLDVREGAAMTLPGGHTVNPPQISLITATENRERVSGENYGNICAVTYDMSFRHPVDSSGPYPVAGLYRKVISPKNTFDSILTELEVTAGAATPEGVATFILPAPRRLSELVNATASVGDGTSEAIISFGHFLNSNIVNLSVDFYAENYVTDNDGVRVRDGVDVVPVPFVYSDRIIDVNSGQEMTHLGRILYADIRMTVLTDEGAKALRPRLDGSTPSSAEVTNIIKTQGTVFSRRVPILSRY